MNKNRPARGNSRARQYIALAVIKVAGRILIAKRDEAAHLGGMWEFPGGKLRSGEQIEQALRREIREELGVDITCYRPLIRFPYDYPGRRLLLDVWQVSDYAGEVHGAEHQEIRWIRPDEFQNYTFPPANAPIILAATLPTYYLITPEPPARAEWPNFLERLHSCLEHGVGLVQFRAPALADSDYRLLASSIIELCHRNGARILLNRNPMMAEQLGADGVHLNSTRLREYSARPMSSRLLLAASCHDRNELELAQRLGCDFAVLSPVKDTASHPQASPLGWQGFKQLVDAATLPVYALGGMERKDCAQAKQHGAQGIAAIRSLWFTTNGT